jgi:signal transduction histidine kinase
VRSQAAAAGVILAQRVIRARVAVRGDAMRLKQVLINLLANGIKYNRPGGSVELRAKVEGTQCVLDVRDTGIGLPADQLDKLFQPFQRLGREATTIEGSGLGLALSQALVQAMGGSLSAHPLPEEEGAGTAFRLVLRLAD